MRNLLLCFLLATLFMACGIKCAERRPVAQTGSPSQMEQNRIASLLRHYHTQFPEATLQDIYKYCFQDYYGPAHLIRDTSGAARYIQEELRYLDSIGWRYEQPYEPLGLRGRFVRVNLAVVRDGCLEPQELAAALARSAPLADTLPVAEWRERWGAVARAARALRMEAYAADSAALDSLLASGEYEFHHSARFNEAYHYGYRLIERGLFERELKPRIDACLTAGGAGRREGR